MELPGKILVIKPSSLGDVVHVFPALEILRRRFPDHELDFVIHPAFAEILDLSPFPVSKKILFRRKELGSLATFFPAFRRLVREIRSSRYDMVIDFQGLFRSGFLAWCARSELTAGFASPREKTAAFFYSRKFAADPTRHAVERYAALANQLCKTDLAVPELTLPEVELGPELRDLLPERFLVLVPGARWETKVFPPAFFAAAVNEARRSLPGLTAVIAGAASDRPLAAAIAEKLPGAVDLTGRTSLLQLAGVMQRAAAVLTNDSGPMHVAALVGTRVFALFGPTLPERTGPYGARHRIFRKEGLSCLGCLKRKCVFPDIPCHALDPAAVGREIGSFVASAGSGEAR
ncbi:MAG: glycosyltransferase family 9 protein [Lentisphaeria bacterium]|nr:glycosyltransferase family 9 protein [Lentisphaeria bacterium]